MTGFVKLYRSVRQTAIADNPEYFAAWIHLLCMATHKEHEQVVGRTVVKLKPGQLVFGRKKFSAETGITEGKTRAALQIMQSLSMITIKSQAKFSVISITNWRKYHDAQPANDQQVTSKRPANDQQMTTNKNDKNEKKGKNTTSIAVCSGEHIAAGEYFLPTNRFETEGETYPVSLDQIKAWEQIYPSVDIDTEIRKMIGWLDGNPKKRKTMAGVKRFANSWLSKAQDAGGSRNTNTDILGSTNW
jgi:hypothetical protein